MGEMQEVMLPPFEYFLICMLNWIDNRLQNDVSPVITFKRDSILPETQVSPPEGRLYVRITPLFDLCIDNYLEFRLLVTYTAFCLRTDSHELDEQRTLLFSTDLIHEINSFPPIPSLAMPSGISSPKISEKTHAEYIYPTLSSITHPVYAPHAILTGNFNFNRPSFSSSQYLQSLQNIGYTYSTVSEQTLTQLSSSSSSSSLATPNAPEVTLNFSLSSNNTLPSIFSFLFLLIFASPFASPGTLMSPTDRVLWALQLFTRYLVLSPSFSRSFTSSFHTLIIDTLFFTAHYSLQFFGCFALPGVQYSRLYADHRELFPSSSSTQAFFSSLSLAGLTQAHDSPRAVYEQHALLDARLPRYVTALGIPAALEKSAALIPPVAPSVGPPFALSAYLPTPYLPVNSVSNEGYSGENQTQQNISQSQQQQQQQQQQLTPSVLSTEQTQTQTLTEAPQQTPETAPQGWMLSLVPYSFSSEAPPRLFNPDSVVPHPRRCSVYTTPIITQCKDAVENVCCY